jgi:hypothetical protein
LNRFWYFEFPCVYRSRDSKMRNFNFMIPPFSFRFLRREHAASHDQFFLLQQHQLYKIISWLCLPLKSSNIMSKDWIDDENDSWMVELVKKEPKKFERTFPERSASSGLYYSYAGLRNAANQPHGRGTMKFQNGKSIFVYHFKLSIFSKRF